MYKIIVFVNNDPPENDKLKAEITEDITIALENLDYNVSSVEFEEIPE